MHHSTDSPDTQHSAIRCRSSSEGQIGLLVSVRSLEEADLVADAGIAILDLKEPSAGPLAPVDPSVWRQVARAWSGQSVLSAAMGEFEEAIVIADQVPAGFSYAKMGPAGSVSIECLCKRWETVRSRLLPEIDLVAVAYADHQAARCPPAIEVFAAANASRMRVWLVDTFEKCGMSTIDQMSRDELQSISKLAEASGAVWAIAGSLKLDAIARLRKAGLVPQWIGVRGGVCEQGREGSLSKSRVHEWLESLSCD